MVQIYFQMGRAQAVVSRLAILIYTTWVGLLDGTSVFRSVDSLLTSTPQNPYANECERAFYIEF